MNAKLILVPTPLDDEAGLDSQTVELLLHTFQQGDLILVEEAKIARRKWLKWGLPREAIETFIEYNEHTCKEQLPLIMGQLKKGKMALIMSDGGMPAFCDPGQDLVLACHQQGIQVTASSFSNSLVLAWAMSGFPPFPLNFWGFLSQDQQKRQAQIVKLRDCPENVALMDTPYRMEKMVRELKEICGDHRQAFLGTNLNRHDEWIKRGTLAQILETMPKEKREFVLILAGKQK